MSKVAPVCHIPPVTTTNQPQPVALPSIPPAQANLASLTATVNAMRQVLIFLVGQQGAQGPQGASGKAAPAGSWTQQAVVTGVVRIYQNNDPTSQNWIDVERVNKLVMGNNTTKQTWVFNRPPDPSGQ